MKNFRNVFLYLFILQTLFSLPAYSQDYSIVFIHIGGEIPPYTETALSQARLFNKNCNIILLANQVALNKFFPKSPNLDLTCISCESLDSTSYHQKFLEKTTLDKVTREGFWLYASERFLYLNDLINQHALENVFHMEYDNMLYVDLSEMLPIFKNKYKGIAATFDNDERCIPGFVYISNPKAMSRLAKCFADHAVQNLNDMQILAIFKKESGAKAIEHLPILTKEYANSNALISPYGHKAKNKNKYYLNIDLFESVFDAAALGQFLGGIDPRNGESKPGFINESCVFNPALLNIEWITDDQQREVPYIVYPHAKYRINNLHIHSKNLTAFASTRNK